MQAVFSMREVRFRRGKTFQLSISALDFFPGVLYALVGPNGSGKSTLLQLLAALETADSGKLSFAGSMAAGSTKRLMEWRRQITLVHQSPYLLNGSVFTNLSLGLKARGVSAPRRRQLIGEALEHVGLAGYEQRNVRQLSGGEKQRTALARALVLQPKMLLLDEPTANIDEAGVMAFERVLQMMTESGACVVFSSHDPVQPERLGAQVLRLRAGRLE
jgi:tungstate transport system ATP-binding protein